MVNITFIGREKYKKQMEKKTMKVVYGFCQSPYGKVLIGVAEDKICHLSFVKSELQNVNELKREWPGAIFERKDEEVSPIAEKAFSEERESLEILCKGTEFQQLVWRELLKVPEGETWSYEQLAKNLGKPTATRACANAVAKNNVGYLIPCHRIVRKSGDIGKYGGGSKIKEKILEAEKQKKNASNG